MALRMVPRTIRNAGKLFACRTASGARRPLGSRCGRARPTARPASILPDGCIDVIWDGTRLLVAGPDTLPTSPNHGPARGTPPCGSALASRRGARHPGPRPARHAGRPRPAAPRRRGDELGETLDAAADPGATIERWASGRLLTAGGPDPAIQHVVRMLDAGAGVAETAESLGIGERQLHRRSLVAFGYGPKVLARILRLQRALRSPHRVDLARLAADAGYADQPHLSREVRALTGLSPTQLLRPRRERQLRRGRASKRSGDGEALEAERAACCD